MPPGQGPEERGAAGTLTGRREKPAESLPLQ
jgi:hypothetical protein